MKRKLLLMAFAACMCAGSMSAQTNLIANGSLETWGGSTAEKKAKPDGFGFNSGAAGTGFYTKSGSNQGYGGTGFCLRLATKNLTKDGSPFTIGTGSTYFTTSDITFPEDDYNTQGCYEFSFYGKGAARIDMLRQNTTSEAMQPFQRRLNTTGWTKYTSSFVYTPTSTTNVSKMYLRVNDVLTDYFHFDEMKVVKVSNSIATLRNIGIQDPASAYGEFLPNFNPATLSYSVDLWFGADTIPYLYIDATNKLSTVTSNYDQVKTFASSETSKTVTIDVTSPDGTDTKQYSITFNRNNFVCGVFSDMFTNSGRGIYSSSNLAVTVAENCACNLGIYSIKPSLLDAPETYLITKKMPNGAKKISFSTNVYGGYESALTAAKAAGTEITISVSYTTDNGTSWNPVDDYVIDLDKNAWETVEFDIDEESSNTQVRIDYMTTGATILAYLIDDIVITPYFTNTSIKDDKIDLNKGAMNVYAKKQSIIIAEEGAYNVYSINGQVIASGKNLSGQVTVPVQKGLYIVKVGNKTKKIAVF